jgi:hypothetical protein
MHLTTASLFAEFSLRGLFPDLALRGWFPWWVALPLWLLAAGLVAVLYMREAGRAAVVPRVSMAVVRLLIVGTVACLLLRPACVSEERGNRARPVAVLVDVSASMNHEDPRPNFLDRWRAAVAFDQAPADKAPDPSMTGLIGPDTPARPKRIEVARAALTSPKLDLLNRLRRLGMLEVSTFGAHRKGQDPTDRNWLKTLAATEPQTALADAVGDLLHRDANDLPAAVVVATDGRENSSKTSLEALGRECARLGVPLHIYGVGSSGFGQLQVRDAVTPDTLFVDDVVQVPVRFRVRGINRGTVKIVLKYGEKEVFDRTLDLDRDGDQLVLKLQDKVIVRQAIEPGTDEATLTYIAPYVPTREDAKADKQELTAAVTVDADGEPLTDSLTRGVKVKDEKLRVLVIDSIPRWDFKYLLRLLYREDEEHRRVIAHFYLTDGDPEALKPGPRSPWHDKFAAARDDFRDQVKGYNLIILGDVPGKFFSNIQQDVLKELVAEGTGLIHIAGRNHAPAGWVKGPIADLMPVEFDAVPFADAMKLPADAIPRPTPFFPVLSPAGTRSPLVSLEDEPLDNAELFGKKDDAPADPRNPGKKLPPLYWHYPVTKLKPGADAFLVHPKMQTADGKDMPLLAGHYFGKGYVLFVGFDETWRWRFNTADKYFGRFWNQAVYMAGVQRSEGTRFTQLSLNMLEPVVGKTGQVYARIFTEQFEPLRLPRIPATLKRLDGGAGEKGEQITLHAILGDDGKPTGEYIAPLPFNREGRFSLNVDPDNRYPAKFDYRVTYPPQHELSKGGMAEREMRDLAKLSGGEFYREEDLDKLPTQVKAQYVPYSRKVETLLWNRWAMVLVIGLLTLEWVLRKFNSLS